MTRDQKRILLIEDEDNIALALDFLMRQEGHAVERVSSGADALPAITRFQPDLVLLDVMLPEVSGYEICQSIRLTSEFDGVKVLMMTARGKAMERRKGIALGADGFIAKPFDVAELRSEVRRLLSDEKAA